jgi:hypothetical protein
VNLIELAEFLEQKGYECELNVRQDILDSLFVMEESRTLEYFIVSSVKMDNALCSLLYGVNKSGKVFVNNYHALRKNVYAFVRTFDYKDKESFLDDIKSSERSLLNLPV